MPGPAVPMVSHPLTSSCSPQVPDCCPGFFGTLCEPCPGGLGGVCSGHGQCQDRLLGSGECRCHEGFHGTACEMCELGRYGPNCTGGDPGGRAGEVGTPARGSGDGDPRAGHRLMPVPPTPSCSQCVTAPMGCARRASAGTEAASATWVGRASAVTRVRSSPPGRGASTGEVVPGSAWSQPSSSHPPRNQWPSVPAEV